MIEPNSDKVAAKTMDMRVKLSTMWIFAMFNYIYADIFTFMNSKHLKEIMAGKAGDFQITEGFLLGAGILMETAIAMVLLARVLPYRANRWANIIAGAIHTAAVAASLFVGTQALNYIFFSTIEILCTLLIVWFAWKWTGPEVKSA